MTRVYAKDYDCAVEGHDIDGDECGACGEPAHEIVDEQHATIDQLRLSLDRIVDALGLPKDATVEQMERCCADLRERALRSNELPGLSASLDEARFERDEARANFLRCAQAIGVVYEREGLGDVPGPIDEVERHIREAVRRDGEAVDAATRARREALTEALAEAEAAADSYRKLVGELLDAGDETSLSLSTIHGAEKRACSGVARRIRTLIDRPAPSAASEPAPPRGTEPIYTREDLARIAHDWSLTIDRDLHRCRIVVVVTDANGSWVGVGSNSSPEDTRAILTSALLGADLKVHGVEIVSVGSDTEPAPAGGAS